MQKKMIGGLVNVPEICSSYDIKWDDYEAPGGAKWIKLYMTELKPIMDDAMKNATKEIAKIKEIEAKRLAIHKGLEAAAAIAKMIMEFTNGNECKIHTLDRIAVKEWATSTCAIANHDVFVPDDSKQSIADIEEDIKYITAVEAYFANDFELDSVLYAMYMVEPKYKAKLFRHVMKLLPLVETNRAIIEASTSVVKKGTFHLLKPCFETLDQSYFYLSKTLRLLKKEAAKGNAGFWENLVFN